MPPKKPPANPQPTPETQELPNPSPPESRPPTIDPQAIQDKIDSQDAGGSGSSSGSSAVLQIGTSEPAQSWEPDDQAFHDSGAAPATEVPERKGKPPKLPKVAIKPEAVRDVLRGQGHLLNSLMAPGSARWLWTDEELDLVAPAAARMASKYDVLRKAAEGSDAATVAMGLTSYAVRNILDPGPQGFGAYEEVAGGESEARGAHPAGGAGGVEVDPTLVASPPPDFAGPHLPVDYPGGV